MITMIFSSGATIGVLDAIFLSLCFRLLFRMWRQTIRPLSLCYLEKRGS